ncbi:MAG TPA: tRNA lysidine(34) synthetase TilS [Usitatibacter sp.]|nr:tRNA lysidine(34) synthetase TilS [Usitatibacter sp.]
MESSRSSPARRELERHVASRTAAAIPRGAAICAGFSGGLDSTVLLDALARVAPALGHRLCAVHVHHGLSPNADAWAASCERQCAALGVPLAIERVHVERASGDGLEAAARSARYAIYARRPEPIVALAHHRDDQAETVLLQLARGTGLKGLAAMPELRALPDSRVSIFRPLLALGRPALLAHARDRGLSWIEDESNASPRHDRNYLRLDVAPRLDARFGGWRAGASRLARHAAAAGELLDELARIDGAPTRPGAGLTLLEGLTPERRANALRAFLAAEGLAMPSESRLAEMSRQLYESREDARVRIALPDAMLVRHRGVARAVSGMDAAAPDAWRVAWRGETLLELGDGRGSVRFSPAVGEGLARELASEGDWHFGDRRGGERVRLGPARPSRTLKNLLREAAVPEWDRGRLPLLFRGEAVAWVPGIGVAAEFACPRGAAGILPAWSPDAQKAAPD